MSRRAARVCPDWGSAVTRPRPIQHQPFCPTFIGLEKALRREVTWFDRSPKATVYRRATTPTERTEMRRYGMPLDVEGTCSDVRRGLSSATMTRGGLPSGTRKLVGGPL